MEKLIDAILALNDAACASEDASCNALVAIRYPDGIRCRACKQPCARDHPTNKATVRCHNHGDEPLCWTILEGTAFGTKRAPRVQMIFLALRALCTSSRSVSARELARELKQPLATVWRHLHTLRAILPTTVMPAPCGAPVVAITHGVRPPPPRVRPRDPDEEPEPPHFLRIGGRGAMHVVNGPRGDAIDVSVDDNDDAPASCGTARILGESIRTWLCGTFHGVHGTWLHRYVQEQAARWEYDDHKALLRRTLKRLLGEPAITFERMARPPDVVFVEVPAPA